MKKRMTIAVVILLFLLGIVTACQQADQTNKNQQVTDANTEIGSQGDMQSVQEEEETENEFILFTDDRGNEVNIPRNPKTVVTSQYTELMLAVGFPPAGATGHTLEAEYLPAEIEQVENIGQVNTMNFEKILEIDPDLIIAHQWVADSYESLSKIAPTIILDSEERDVLAQMELIGSILNKTEEAEEWIANYLEVVAEAKSQLSEIMEEGETVGIYRVFDKGAVQFFTGNVGYVFEQSLELDYPQTIIDEIEKDPGLPAFTISLEVLDDFAADYMFMLVFDAENPDEFEREIFSSGLWRSIEPYKKDRIFIVNADTWFQAEPLSFEPKIREAVKLISGE